MEIQRHQFASSVKNKMLVTQSNQFPIRRDGISETPAILFGSNNAIQEARDRYHTIGGSESAMDAEVLGSLRLLT